MTATCSACGAPLQGEARFCNNCGAPTGSPPPAAAPDSAPAAAATDPLMECRVSLLKYVLRPRLWLAWAVLVGVVVGWILLSLPLIGVLALMVLTALVLCFWWLEWRTNRLVIYPDRLVRHQGFLNRTERTDPIWRIQDVVLKTKWYGLGWVYFETAGDESDAGFGPIRNAAEVRDLMYKLIRRHTTA